MPSYAQGALNALELSQAAVRRGHDLFAANLQPLLDPDVLARVLSGRARPAGRDRIHRPTLEQVGPTCWSDSEGFRVSCTHLADSS